MLKKKYLAYFVLFILLFEIGLRVTGPFKVYSEVLGQKYRSYWGFEHKGYYKILPKSQNIEYEQPEFKVSYRTNQLGMRNREVTMQPKDSILRILCLGDSFTQGDGASNGNSFPRQLERILNRRYTNKKYEVINAGSSGSDIIYCERLLVDIAYTLEPDLVLVTTNDSDIEDIIQRGGRERFKNNQTKFKDGPWYENIYAKSHVVRFVTHAILRKSNLFLSPKAAKSETAKANIIMTQSIARMTSFCEDRSIQIRFIIHPYPGSIKNIKNEQELDSQIDLESHSYYSNRAIYNLNEPLIDTLKQIPYSSYAWPLNGHFNDNGYKIMSEAIFENIDTEHLLN